eukprot:CAMPEP_0178986526 /NCGR_PEP_ID=MMETSP0795-20121207/2750_1 /TAXON_ID=88552 /ORGANISM="Amoebophrya sp., Strain Ameob2" /LENGTH=483 /DNA_ID=CAMNT_0020677591 /DNA_START=52 /DNA_END=1503 /DNA_ORIENTATION=+
MGEVRVTLKSAFGLAKDAKNPYAKLSLLSKIVESFTTSVAKGVADPEWDEEFVFAKVKHAQPLSLKFEVFDSADGGKPNAKADTLLGCNHVHELKRIRNLEVQRKLMNAKCNEIVDGVIFAEYSYIPEKLPSDKAPVEVPEAEEVDGDDAGCLCGFVYVEAVDAIDLDGEHLLAKKGGKGGQHAAEDDDDEEDKDIGLATKQKINWNTVLEVTCSKQCKTRPGGFSWRTLEVEGTPNPAWNEGCSFPVDFESSDHLKPIKVRVLQDEEVVGSTLCDIPLTPVSRIYVKRIHSETKYEVKGYVVVKVGFVPFGFRVTDLLTETVMDEMATADFLGMRRKYSDVIAQNHEYQDVIQNMQDKIDDLEGIKKDDQFDDTEQERIRDERGPSMKARWHFFAMAAEPWSKATKVSAYKLRLLLEESLPDRRQHVVPLIRATTTSAYLNFRECNMLLNEFGMSKREWKKLVASVLKVNMQPPAIANEILA